MKFDLIYIDFYLNKTSWRNGCDKNYKKIKSIPFHFESRSIILDKIK